MNQKYNGSNIVFTASMKTKSGKIIYARDYGKKAFSFRVRPRKHRR